MLSIISCIAFYVQAEQEHECWYADVLYAFLAQTNNQHKPTHAYTPVSVSMPISMYIRVCMPVDTQVIFEARPLDTKPVEEHKVCVYIYIYLCIYVWPYNLHMYMVTPCANPFVSFKEKVSEFLMPC